jgi:hypothetical protein
MKRKKAKDNDCHSAAKRKRLSDLSSKKWPASYGNSCRKPWDKNTLLQKNNILIMKPVRESQI